MADNKLFYGDNLDVLRRYVRDESVDLIYLDPPFNSRQDYNVLFAEKDGTRSSSQITAFEDTWEWNLDAERAYQEIVEHGGMGVERHAGLPQVPRPQRHDGVSRHDGSAPSRTEARAQGDWVDLPALRSDGQPLLEDADGCGVRPAELSQ